LLLDLHSGTAAASGRPANRLRGPERRGFWPDTPPPGRPSGNRASSSAESFVMLVNGVGPITSPAAQDHSPSPRLLAATIATTLNLVAPACSPYSVDRCPPRRSPPHRRRGLRGQTGPGSHPCPILEGSPARVSGDLCSREPAGAAPVAPEPRGRCELGRAGCTSPPVRCRGGGSGALKPVGDGLGTARRLFILPTRTTARRSCESAARAASRRSPNCSRSASRAGNTYVWCDLQALRESRKRRSCRAPDPGPPGAASLRGR
jgi:hypothetical protein